MAKISLTDQNTGRNVNLDLYDRGDVLPVCLTPPLELPPIEILPPVERPHSTVSTWINNSNSDDMLSIHVDPGEEFHLQTIYIIARREVLLIPGYLDTGIFTRNYADIVVYRDTQLLTLPLIYTKTFILKIFRTSTYTVGVSGLLYE